MHANSQDEHSMSGYIHVGILQYNMVYAPHTYVFHPKQFGDHGSVRDKNAASFLR